MCVSNRRSDETDDLSITQCLPRSATETNWIQINADLAYGQLKDTDPLDKNNIFGEMSLVSISTKQLNIVTFDSLVKTKDEF